MRKVTKLWKTKDGKRIRICDMEDSHLLNAIKCLERMVVIEKLETPFPSFNGEMAQYYSEQAYDQILNSPPEYFFPIYEDLLNERERRLDDKTTT